MPLSEGAAGADAGTAPVAFFIAGCVAGSLEASRFEGGMYPSAGGGALDGGGGTAGISSTLELDGA